MTVELPGKGRTDMPHVAQLFFKTAIVFLIIGIGVGLHMGISEDHSAFTAHAHINLLGWVTSAIFGGYYALNRSKAERRISRIHYGVYTIGLAIMLPSLYMKYGFGMTWVEPILGVSSIVVALGILIFGFVVFSEDTQRAAMPAASVPAE
jgi:hypothetical protein